MLVSEIPLTLRKEVGMGKLRVALYFLPACGLGFLLVLVVFFAGAMLSLFVAPPSGRSTDEVLWDGAGIGFTLYLATVWALQHRFIGSAPMLLRVISFFVIPVTLVILFGRAYYLETGVVLAIIAAPPLCPLLIYLSDRKKK